jgi:uncharacterized membrane-anchored protein YhcB (DUF1043 family)
MLAFQDEEKIVQGSLQRKLPQLEDIATRGRIVAKDIYVLTNRVKATPAHANQEDCTEDNLHKWLSTLSKITEELTIYFEKSAVIIDDLTKTLTEVR